MASFEVRGTLDNAAIMTLGNLVVGVWSGEPSLTACKEMSVVYRDLYNRYPDGFAICVIVENGVPLPDDSVRKAVGDLMKDVQSRVLALCGVQEATGFRGAAIRSVLTALTMMTRQPYKTTTLATVAEAGAWISPYVVPATSASQINSAITQFRMGLGERRRRLE